MGRDGWTERGYGDGGTTQGGWRSVWDFTEVWVEAPPCPQLTLQGQWLSHGVQALHKLPITKGAQGRGTHSGHDAHAGHHVG